MELTDSSSNLLGRLIDSVNSGDFEERLQEWIQSCLPFEGITCIAYCKNKKPRLLHLWAQSKHTHSLIDTTYLDDAYRIDPFYELHAKGVEPGVYRLKDVAPDQFQRSEYYKIYYKFTMVLDEIGMFIYPSKDVTIVISISQNKHHLGRFNRSARLKINVIFPIVAALSNMHYAKMGEDEVIEVRSDHVHLATVLKDARQISLSPRQSQVALLVIKGHSSASIGLILGVSPQTVKVFRRQVYKRCNISSQGELFHLLFPLLNHEK